MTDRAGDEAEAGSPRVVGSAAACGGDEAGAGSPGEVGSAPASTDARVVLTTTADEAAAERLVGALVEEGLAACGTIVPGALSIYRWQGALQREREALVLLKTTSARLAALLERLPALHPYEVPEVLALAVGAGHGPYLDWLRRSVGILQERD